jgi:hypothetical protein
MDRERILTLAERVLHLEAESVLALVPRAWTTGSWPR